MVRVTNLRRYYRARGYLESRSSRHERLLVETRLGVRVDMKDDWKAIGLGISSRRMCRCVVASISARHCTSKRSVTVSQGYLKVQTIATHPSDTHT